METDRELEKIEKELSYWNKFSCDNIDDYEFHDYDGDEIEDLEEHIKMLEAKKQAEQDFDDRVDISEHQFKVDIGGDSDVPME